MTNDRGKGPLLDPVPSNAEDDSVIGAWSFIGHWSLVISNCVWLRLELENVIVLREGELRAGKQPGGQAARLLQALPIVTSNVGEGDVLDLASLKITEQFLRLKVGYFANEQIERLRQQRLQVPW